MANDMITAIAIGALLAFLMPLSTSASQNPCDVKLIGSSAQPACEGTWDNCEFGQCCTHWHSALNWNVAIRSGLDTGKDAGPSTKKYFDFKTGHCDTTTIFGGTGKCIMSGWSAHAFPSAHYKDDDTLVDC